MATLLTPIPTPIPRMHDIIERTMISRLTILSKSPEEAPLENSIVVSNLLSFTL